MACLGAARANHVVRLDDGGGVKIELSRARVEFGWVIFVQTVCEDGRGKEPRLGDGWKQFWGQLFHRQLVEALGQPKVIISCVPVCPSITATVLNIQYFYQSYQLK